MTSSDPTFRFSIDRGGTFADIYCDIVHSNKIISRKVLKLLSEDPLNYNDAPTEGIRRVMEQELKVSLPRNNPIPTKQIEYIRMGTTVATNALLERKGERVAFITTKGFADIQFIGNQSRPKIFDLEIKRPDLLYEHVAELNERVIFHKESVSELKSSPISKAKENSRIVTTLSNEKLIIESPINEEEVLIELHKIKSLGINSLAVCLLHSYIFPDHEKIVQRLAQQVGFSQISLSSDVMPMIRMVPRGCTTCVDAYLTPVIKRYLDSFVKGFDEHLQKDNKVSFMQSDGGLTSMQSFFGNRAILSGPAGGVVGFAMTFTDYRRGKHASSTLGQSNSKSHSSPINSDSDAVIGFDMGGTSTDVSRYAGEYEHVFESITAGITIQSPQLDINTVAAGGGSRLFFKNGLFTVGPESAGAHPGPVCYRKGGPLTVTDANVLLGRVQPHLFPSIFGHSEKEMLDAEATRAAFESLTIEINEQSRSKSIQYTVEEVASGFIRVANEAMARPIRNLTTMKGRDVTKHSLATFGGAGPQHCCAIAKSLGIKQIFISKYSGVLSAYGLSLADVVIDRQEPADGSDIIQSMPSMLPRLAILNQSARSELAAQGFHDVNMNSVFYLNCRYQGTDTSMMIPFPSNVSPETLTATQFQQLFIDTYKREYGFELVGRAVLVDDVRVRVVGNASQTQSNSQSQVKSVVPADKVIASASKGDKDTVKPQEYASVYFDDLGRHRTPVYRLISLVAGDQILGPAIIIQDITTIVIEPECRAALTPNGDIEVEVLSSGNKVLSTAMDPIYLSIFSHRFMGIAEQMGRTLQRTSISVNIKERLDFSCALFDPQGGLVANAPHLPVHLGAMSEAVRYQKRYWGDDLREGDVLVSNHPQLAGGSHLPDITVITPIYIRGVIAFFVASRGHHADVGGIAPGSMPPLSRTLKEEGAAIVAFKLVKDGVFQEEGIVELLKAPGQIPGNSGARKVQDNLSDLRAQVAANQKGAGLMHELVAEYSLEVIQAYMVHIQNCAAEAVRSMLRQFSLNQNMETIDTVCAEDCLDDGTPICLSITIDRDAGTAVFDFAGTGQEVFGNLNAPPAVSASAIIYCLRCLLPESDIPLNQGCLEPVTILIPDGSILKPCATAAVVGGNVLTSQRVTDVVLKAFSACAASQGCMNNLTFGNATMGYYETIAGGAGAGPNWHGCSAVHTHMTNTRITDPEIFEKRYPVILRQFSVRRNSGGAGLYRGGDGVIREIEFTEPLIVSILSERRAIAPYGMAGGACASKGLNLLLRPIQEDDKEPTAGNNSIEGSMSKKRRLVHSSDDSKNNADVVGSGGSFRTVNIGSKSTVSVDPGDRLVIMSPGGGGYGAPSSSNTTTDTSNATTNTATLSSLSVNIRISGSLQDYTSMQESV